MFIVVIVALCSQTINTKYYHKSSTGSKRTAAAEKQNQPAVLIISQQSVSTQSAGLLAFVAGEPEKEMLIYEKSSIHSAGFAQFFVPFLLAISIQLA